MANDERISPSAVRKASQVTQWDWEADVVIVGYGCAGACAAIEAAEAGAAVLVLERFSGGGGTSANSGGLLYMGGGTPVQKACGFDDTPEEMYTFLMAALGPQPDAAKVRMYCDESVAHFHWFEQHGIPFKRSFAPEGDPAPTDDCLVYTGGEDAYPFRLMTKPVARGHKPQYPAEAGGFLMQRLVAAAERAGARIECDARCETLVVDEQGRVVGVVVWQNGRERHARAHRGVVLAAGGFVMNRDMVAHHVPLIERCGTKLGTDGDDGRAIRMAMGARAEAIHMNEADVAITITPPRRLMRGILVNGYGQRFINEDTYYARMGYECVFGQNGQMFLIVDTAIYEPTFYGFQAAFVEETVAELEQAIGLPTGSLQATLAYYNGCAARGEDPLFHKVPDLLQPLSTPPYAAFDYRLAAHPEQYFTFTLGGLHTRPTGEVVDPDGNVIPGLYAAGRTTSGLAAGGYCSGISLGDGSFFGRQAGRSAATAARDTNRQADQ